MTPSLDRALAKLDWAQQHFNKLDVEFEAFRATQPYRVVRDSDPQHGFYIYRIKVAGQPPPEIGLIIGDFIHNVRSALDYLAWELALPVVREQEPSRIEFPIYKDFPIPPRKLAPFSDEVQDAFKAVQPYNRYGWDYPESDPLWVLHRLDIIQKHRTITPLGLRVTLNYDFGIGFKQTDHLMFMGVLNDGDEVARFPIESASNVGFDVQASFHVVFERIGPLGGVTVSTLKAIYSHVRQDVISRLSSHFPDTDE